MNPSKFENIYADQSLKITQKEYFLDEVIKKKSCFEKQNVKRKNKELQN